MPPPSGGYTGEKSRCRRNFVDDGRATSSGEHKGIIHYTVGQRRGLGISGTNERAVRVQDSIRRDNDGRPRRRRRTLYPPSDAAAADVNWISGETPREPVRCAVKIRYRADGSRPRRCIAEENGRGRIVFDAPQCAVTPGQAAVFYDGNTVLGGGTIE